MAGDDEPTWHPSGCTPVVVGDQQEIVGFTKLQVDPVSRFMMSKAPPRRETPPDRFAGQDKVTELRPAEPEPTVMLTGEVLKVRFRSTPWYAWQVVRGDPADLPNYFSLAEYGLAEKPSGKAD